MPKAALKFFAVVSVLHRKHRRMDRSRAIAIFGTLVTIGLIALYASRHGMVG